MNNPSTQNKKKPFFVRKWEKIKKWYRNRTNPNQWVTDMLTEKRHEFVKLFTIKYNYRTSDNVEELIQQMILEINHQAECIQFVQTISQLPQRFSFGSTSSADSESSSYSAIANTSTPKMRGAEIDLEILHVEHTALKEHLSKCIEYLKRR